MRRGPLIGLMLTLALLALIVWYAERGWRDAQREPATPPPSAPVQRETFAVVEGEAPAATGAAPPSDNARPSTRLSPVPPPAPAASAAAPPPHAAVSARGATASVPASAGIDERPLWELLRQGRHAELREAIAEREAEQPSWRPPVQLVELLTAAEADAAYAAALAALDEAVAAGDRARIGRAAEALVPQVEARRDPGAARMLGWVYHDGDQDEAAAAWFERAQRWAPSEDGAYGLALVRQRQGDLAAAEAAARDYADSPRVAALLYELALARAHARHEAGDYAGSEAALADAAHYGEWDRAARLLHGWNLARLGRHAEAGEVFAALYRASPDEESADGLLSSYERAGRDAALARLSEELGGPLAEKYHRREAQRAYARKQFLRAADSAPAEFPLLAHIDAADAMAGVILRTRSGTSGLSRLELVKAPWLEAGVVTGGVTQWRLKIDDVHLDSGGLASTLVGSAPLAPQAFVAAPTTRVDAGWEPSLSVVHEGRFAPYASIGTTPLDGPLAERWIGSVGAVWYGTRHTAGLEWAARPVRESILSYVGSVDPYSGAAWGRVVSQGLRAQLHLPLRSAWSVYTQARWAELSGERVQDNTQVALDVALNRGVQRPGFDHLSVGPYVGYESYERNLGHFTVGHGGYFSPQHALRAGVALAALTEEGRDVVMRGRLALGYQTQRQDAAPLLPLAPDGRQYAASDDRSAAIDAEWYGVWRLAPHWQLGGGLAYRRDPSYEDIYAGAFVRYSLEARPALFSRDLPPALFGAVQ